jgi:large subunit ribosomal protein L5
LAKEKAAPPAEKKVKTKKKAAKAPVDAKKALKAEKAAKKGQPAEKELVAKKKVSSAEEKVAPKKKAAEPKVTPAKETKKVSEKKVDEAKTPSAKKKPVSEEKAEPKVDETERREWTKNPMLMPRIEKVTVNMSVGQSGKPLEQAATILQQLTDQTPSRRQAKKTIREFGIRKGESVACIVTLRKEKAEEFLRKALQAVENKLSKYCFDRQGNFAFGIKEHIDIPGTKYMPQLGIHGMDISVSLGRAGYRVKRRHRVKSKIGKEHLLTADEAKLFIKDEFDVEII